MPFVGVMPGEKRQVLPAGSGAVFPFSSLTVLRWEEPGEPMRGDAKISVNKAVLCRSRVHGGGFKSSLLARRGDEDDGDLYAPASRRLDLQQGSMCASLGRFLTAAVPSSFTKVEGRPLLPRALVTVGSSSRRHQVLINHQVAMPLRRPSVFGAACSRLLVPSGLVPGDVEVGCAQPCCGGEGAGPDCFSNSSSRVPGANCKGLVVIFGFLEAILVSCISTAYNE